MRFGEERHIFELFETPDFVWDFSKALRGFHYLSTFSQYAVMKMLKTIIDRFLLREKHTLFSIQNRIKSSIKWFFYRYFVLMLLGLEELENFHSCKIYVRLFSRSQWP